MARVMTEVPDWVMTNPDTIRDTLRRWFYDELGNMRSAWDNLIDCTAEMARYLEESEGKTVDQTELLWTLLWANRDLLPEAWWEGGKA